jgi:hypothetical protein
MTLTIGELQYSALACLVFEALDDDHRLHDEQPFPGILQAEPMALLVDDDAAEQAWRIIVDAANDADDMGDPEWRDALQKVASRVLKKTVAIAKKKVDRAA